MCRTLDSPQLVHQQQHIVVTDMASTERSTLAKPMKPKLPRKITKSPRINLNNYWDVFKEIMDEPDSSNLTTTIINVENVANERRLALMDIRGDGNEDTGKRSPGSFWTMNSDDLTLDNVPVPDNLTLEEGTARTIDGTLH